jgi:hypothetical protein
MREALPVAVLGILLVAAGSTGLAQGKCVSRGQGRDLIEQGEAIPFPEALRQAGLPADQIVDVQLCRTGSGLVYRVRVAEGATVRGVSIAAGSEVGGKSGAPVGAMSGNKPGNPKAGNNPGNNKNVGRAGESPNGKGFGGGTRGRSDAGSKGAGRSTGGKSNGSERGNSNGSKSRN